MVLLLDVVLPVLAGRLALVRLVLKDGEVAAGDFFGFLLFQDILQRNRVVVSVHEVFDVGVGVAVVCEANGGGDREGEDGGEDEELHVGFSRWFGWI